MDKTDLILAKIEKIEKLVEKLCLYDLRPAPTKKIREDKELKYKQVFENFTGREYIPKDQKIDLPVGYKLAKDPVKKIDVII
jgi:hypothetical protein